MSGMANQKKAAKPQSSSKKSSESKPASAAAPAHGIDPAKSAASAAAMVAHKVSNPTPSQGPKVESSGFRNLKESAAKPHAQGIGGVLDKLTPAGQKRSGLPFGPSKQVGHNQTFGADVSRRSVPRRTGGG
jgi:hypothetical protein